MADGPVVVHLIGFPGAGKYTVARALAERAVARNDRRFVVVDNHLTSNVIFSVMDVDGVRPVPKAVWGLVGDVRAAMCTAIEEFSPPEWSFVFTNVLTEREKADVDIYERLTLLAQRRGHPYVPIYIRCASDEHLRRVSGTDRRERFKWVDVDAVRAFTVEHELFRFDEPPFEVDVTTLAPEEAADRILDHIAAL